MLKISDESKAIYLSGNTKKNITIVFPDANVTMTNSDIVEESFELTEAIENTGEISFEGCIASKFSFQCANFVQDLRGEYVEVTISATGAEAISLFKGYVDTQTNRTHEDVVTEFTCYDAIYRKGQLDVTSWYNGLNFPMTVQAFRNSFFNRIGITQDSRTLVNDSQRINKVVTENQILALDVMRNICQVNAAYGRMGRDGQFKYVELLEIVKGLYPSEDLFPSPDLYPARENAGAEFDKDGYISASYEPFEVRAIDRVNVVGFDGRFSGGYGSGTNALNIADNIVAQGAVTPSKMAENILNKIYMVRYIPSNVEIQGLPWIEPGDIYLFNTYKNIVRAYVFNRNLKGIHAMFDTYEADGNQRRSEYKESPLTQTTANETAIQENTADIEQNTEDIAQNAQDIIYTQGLAAQWVEAEKIRTNELVTNEIRTTRAYADEITAKAIKTTELYADNIGTKTLNAANVHADNVGTNTLNAANLHADNVSSNALSSAKIYTENLTANKATVSQLNAVDGKFSNLNANNITSGTVNTKRLNIDGIVEGMSSKNLRVVNLSATGLITIGPYVAHWNSGTFKDGSGNNVTITYLGR